MFSFLPSYKNLAAAQAFGTVVNLYLAGPGFSCLCPSCPGRLKKYPIPSSQTRSSLRTNSHTHLSSPLSFLPSPPPELKPLCLTPESLRRAQPAISDESLDHHGAPSHLIPRLPFLGSKPQTKHSDLPTAADIPRGHLFPLPSQRLLFLCINNSLLVMLFC